MCTALLQHVQLRARLPQRLLADLVYSPAGHAKHIMLSHNDISSSEHHAIHSHFWSYEIREMDP